MRIKSGYLLREIAGFQVVVPIGNRVIDFKGILTLKGIGYFIWSMLQDGATYEQLLIAVLEKFEVLEEEARVDLDEFIAKVKHLGVLEDE